jgi:hypothetical protein
MNERRSVDYEALSNAGDGDAGEVDRSDRYRGREPLDYPSLKELLWVRRMKRGDWLRNWSASRRRRMRPRSLGASNVPADVSSGVKGDASSRVNSGRDALARVAGDGNASKEGPGSRAGGRRTYCTFGAHALLPLSARVLMI